MTLLTVLESRELYKWIVAMESPVFGSWQRNVAPIQLLNCDIALPPLVFLSSVPQPTFWIEKSDCELVWFLDLHQSSAIFLSKYINQEAYYVIWQNRFLPINVISYQQQSNPLRTISNICCISSFNPQWLGSYGSREFAFSLFIRT